MHRDLLPGLGARARGIMEVQWNWKRVIHSWIAYFEECL